MVAVPSPKRTNSTWLVCMSVIMLSGIAYAPARANDDPALIKQQEALLHKKTTIEQQIRNAQQRLRQLDQDRRDKLEELGELHRALAELSQRRQISKDVENEIASQTSALHRIEEQRSDCLEELEGLYFGLTQINRDVAQCDKKLHNRG
ncbi:MAG: hypothetical protein K2Z81_14400 [Cyanobacteria bacterium]|nr:hypothetical protein [Cyanobacteriota bacterium]